MEFDSLQQLDVYLAVCRSLRRLYGRCFDRTAATHTPTLGLRDLGQPCGYLSEVHIGQQRRSGHCAIGAFGTSRDTIRFCYCPPTEDRLIMAELRLATGYVTSTALHETPRSRRRNRWHTPVLRRRAAG